MITKKNLLMAIKDLPDNFTMDEFVDRVLFIEKVQEGLKQSKAGRTFCTSQAKQMLKKGCS